MLRKCFNMNNAKPVTISFATHCKLSTDISPKIDEEMEHMFNVPYSSVVGSIMYVMVCTRPNISHAVSVGTIDVGLIFEKANMSDSVIGYVDLDFGDLNKRRSLTGYLFTLSRSAISWKAILQATIALSTIKAKYITLAKTVKEALWLKEASVVATQISSSSAASIIAMKLEYSSSKNTTTVNDAKARDWTPMDDFEVYLLAIRRLVLQLTGPVLFLAPLGFVIAAVKGVFFLGDSLFLRDIVGAIVIVFWFFVMLLLLE
ncbi:hypothetical protein GH714_034043 [Hevea brasiliensis]|uniref:Reverse transcriptase Ty1/copia-type domain-containing protein n=1 Tax=Hevea brasiliensis TaxID=3981 RepID=A0A6A6KLD1_HEVBR|nr:hypothetical protein GH714_034043 [Hevea brasiliensis]